MNRCNSDRIIANNTSAVPFLQWCHPARPHLYPFANYSFHHPSQIHIRLPTTLITAPLESDSNPQAIQLIR